MIAICVFQKAGVSCVKLTGHISYSSLKSRRSYQKMERESVLQALHATTIADDQKKASEFLDQRRPLAVPESPRRRPRFSTTSTADDVDEWTTLTHFLDTDAAHVERRRRQRVSALMDRWRKAALKAVRKQRVDPWAKYNINNLPVLRAKRFRYSSIRKTWTEDMIEVKLLQESFARGAMRECFRLKKMSSMLQSDDWRLAQNYVAKRYLQVDVDKQVLFEDVKLQMDAKLWAEEFNRHDPPKKIDIVQMCVLQMIDLPGEPYMHLEHYIEGDYVKYNSNSGFVSEVSRKTPHAFTHFTFERSAHQMIVVDIQGVGDLYTDPQIHTVAGTEYGDGNLGTRGMALFFKSHQCNDICHSLCLTEFDLSDTEKKAIEEGTASAHGSVDATTKFVRNVSACSAIVPEAVVEVDAMECLRQRTATIRSRCSSTSAQSRAGSRASHTSGEGDAEHDDNCVCDECLDKVTMGVTLGADDVEDEEEDEEEVAPQPIVRKSGRFNLQVERERYDSMCSSHGSSRLTRETEREEFWLGRKKSVPAGVFLQQCKDPSKVTNQASILGQIHLDVARYHEMGRFLPESEMAARKLALDGMHHADTECSIGSGDSNDVCYDRESALFHLDVAKRCGVLEAIVTVAQMAYGMPHELLKDIGHDENWTGEDGNADKEAAAFELMLTAAEMGDRQAMLFVAEAFETGRKMGVKGRASYPQAIEWYQKVLGFSDGEGEEGGVERPRYELLHKMADMYKEGGCGLAQDFELAYQLYTEAAEVAMECMKGRLANKYYEMAEMCACTKLAGFAPELLKIVLDASLPESVRQAAVIYFKNCISRYWEKDGEDEDPDTFELNEQDKTVIRDNIVDAIVLASDLMRVQLCSAVQNVIRSDFPDKWPALPNKLHAMLTTADGPSWHGAYNVIYRLAKVYEYKRAKERAPLTECMRVLLPLMLAQLKQLQPNHTQEAVLLQKLILKCFYCLVQFSLNADMLAVPEMDSWLEAIKEMLLLPIPSEVDQLEEASEKEATVWWKAKKWAGKILERVFERYGAPGQVDSAYAEFATHFVAKFSHPCVEAFLQLLAQKRQGVFVSSRVTHLSISFLTTAVSHSHSWLLIKPHVFELVKTVLFPLMSHSADDEELWEDDVEEYIRFKFDIFEDLHNPSHAAGALLAAVSKRKDVLQPILGFVIEVLHGQSGPTEVDGALHMIGELAQQLCKSKKYKKDVEKLLDAHVIARLADPARFVRARAAWCLKVYSGTHFSGPRILKKVVEGLVKRLCDVGEELPVKVEAALGIQYLLNDQQEKVLDMVRPAVKEVIPRVLELVAKTQIEDVVSVMDELIENYIEDVVPIAGELADQLCVLFLSVISEEYADDRTATLMSVINTLTTILDVIEDHKEIMSRVEESVLKVIRAVFATKNVDYYDDILMLIQSLITSQISEPMWAVFFDVYDMFKNDNQALVQFSDVMPVLHLYMTVDTESFLARPERLNATLEMCQIVLQDMEQGDENQLYAAKLLETMVLGCAGAIDQALPAIMMLALQRLTQPFEGLSELKPMLLLVVVAAVYTNTELAARVLREIAPNHPNPLDYLADELAQLTKKFEGVHDRKMALLGWCVLLRLSADARPQFINYQPKKVIESCVDMFEGLQKAQKLQSEYRNKDGESDDEYDSDDYDEDDEDDAGEVVVSPQSRKKAPGKHRKMDEDLSDNEDEIDEGTLEYLESLARAHKKADGLDSSDDDDSECSEGFVEETDTEAFCTRIDEEESVDVFVLFKQTMEMFEQREPALFQQMIGSLEAEQADQLKKLIVVCSQHASLEASKAVEQAGGYSFDAQAAVPSNFNFGQ